MGQPLEWWVCNWTKRATFIVSRFPIFSHTYLASHIDKPTTSREELKQYEDNSTRVAPTKTIIIMILYFLYCCKLAYALIKSFLLFDHSDPQRNIHRQVIAGETAAFNGETTSGDRHNNGPTVWSSFACLTTNCHYFSTSHSLAHDADLLPLMDFCIPQFGRSLYRPMSALDHLGLLAWLTSCFFIGLIGILMVLYSMLHPAGSEVLMFLLAPKVTKNKMRSEARQIAARLAESMQNFHHNSMSYSLTISQLTAQLREGSLQELQCAIADAAASFSVANRYYYHELHCNSESKLHNEQQGDDEKKADSGLLWRVADDCLPAIRSDWWRIRMMKVFSITLCCSYVLLLIFVLAAYSYIGLRIRRKELVFAEFARQMALQNCSLWRSADLNSPLIETNTTNKLVKTDLSSYKIGWSFFEWILTFVFNFSPSLTMGAIFPCYVGLIMELSCWRSELRLYLNEALDCLRHRRRTYGRPSNIFHVPLIQRHAPCSHFEHRKRRQRSSATFDIRHLRMRFIRQVDPASQQQKHSTWQAEIEKNAALMMDCDNDEAIWATLERIYINFRLHAAYVDSNSASMGLFLGTAYVLNFGLVSVAIFFSWRVVNFTTEPMFIVAFGLTLAFQLIVIASKFHANAKKLHPILWSLISQLTDLKEVRAQHLRALLVKFAVQLDSSDGVCLSVLGTRVTYVNIIQLMLWTSTILVVAHKKQT